MIFPSEIQGRKFTVAGKVIDGNEGDFGGGIWITTPTNTVINNSTIQNNISSQGNGAGLYLDRIGSNGSGLIMTNTRILNNHAFSRGGGLYLNDSNNETIFGEICRPPFFH